MASFSMRQAERILGLPASTLRHWERETGLVEPRRDPYGRRVFSGSDIRLLLRLKHLALGRGLGLAAAKRLLLEEMSGPAAEARALLAEIRGELVDLMAAAMEAGNTLGPARELPDEGGSDGGRDADSGDEREGGS
jgi:DNA-binding transcriptional MerR regulator